jgi:tetratricopeptide (TPR) repeat protein
MARYPSAQEKYTTMSLVLRRFASLTAAWSAAPLLALALASAPVRADDIQDINRLMKQGQHAQALERVNKYLAQKPRDAQGRFLKGLILTEQNKIPDAIEVFSQLSQDYPELPEPYNNLAVLYATQGQYEKARQSLEMSIRTHPSYATAYENLGDVYTKLASQAYDKALQLDSSNSVAQNKLSLIREITNNNRPGGKPPGAPVPATPGAAADRPAVAAAPKAPPAPSASKPAAKAPPVATKAETTPAKEAAAAASPGRDEVLKTVEAWANAWSHKDVGTYLSFYANDFKPPKGESRSSWEKARKERIAAPKRIQVRIDAPKVTLKSENEAVVSFRQHYRSDNLQSRNSKTLVMARADGKWKIVQERAGG